MKKFLEKHIQLILDSAAVAIIGGSLVYAAIPYFPLA